MLEYKAQVKILLREQAADKSALKSANQQVLQLSADLEKATGKCAVLQSIVTDLENRLKVYLQLPVLSPSMLWLKACCLAGQGLRH